VPVALGSRGAVRDEAEARQIGQKVGFPLLIKAAAGGGGKGMRVAANASELSDAFHVAQAEAKAAFGNADMYIERFIDQARQDKDAEVIFGGTCDKSKGYFIEPTVIQAKVPDYITMQEELFGPVLTIYVYPEEKLDETLDVLDKTSIYALTGAVFSQDRYTIEKITKRLENTAGNFYINDKPTGAVVGQQPFGGARGSGTNDKAGSLFNFLRWVSVRTIKENLVPPTDYMYPNFLPDTE
ncbi:MAG: aldehyde dehydrogenase family protein, partial [Prolixibacteraceae bacterium]